MACHSPDKDLESLHKELLYSTLAIDYLHPTVDKGIPAAKFKANCREFLDCPLSLNNDEPSCLLEELEKAGHIGIGDYDNLKKIVCFDIRIINEIEKTELVMKSQNGMIYLRKNRGKIENKKDKSTGER